MSHDAGEVDKELKRRLLYHMKHPGGWFVGISPVDIASTDVSLNPILTAAAAHDA